MLSDYLTLESQSVEIRYAQGDYEFAQVSHAALDRALPAITGYFGLPSSFPKVRVVLVPSRAEFDRLVRDLLGVAIETHSNPGRIAQAQRTDTVVLSPPAYEIHSSFEYDEEGFRRLLVHELVHMVEEFLSPDIEASPRWWSEGLAVYLSDQWRLEGDYKDPVLHGISGGNVPGVAELAADVKLAYDWGWTIVRFVEDAFGRQKVVQIVRECADGDLFSMLGEETSSLERRWKHWLVDEFELE